MRASVSAFQESRDQSGKPDGGEKWQDKIFAAHTCKRGGVGGGYNDPTYGTASRVERAAGGWISLMTTVIPLNCDLGSLVMAGARAVMRLVFYEP